MDQLAGLNKNDVTLHRDSTTQVKTVCERELSALMLVAPVLLLDSPCIIYLVAVIEIPDKNSYVSFLRRKKKLHI